MDMEGGMRGICAKVMYKYILFGCFFPKRSYLAEPGGKGDDGSVGGGKAEVLV